MGELARWVGQILTLVVLFSLLDIIIPDSPLRGLVRTVMGVAVVATILGPVVALVGTVPGGAWGWGQELWSPRAPAVPAGVTSVDPEGLASALWDEAQRAATEQAEQRIRQAAARYGVALAGIEWVQGADGAVRAVRLHPQLGAVGPDALQGLRRDAAWAAGLDEADVWVGEAPHGPGLPAASGPAAGSEGWADGTPSG